MRWCLIIESTNPSRWPQRLSGELLGWSYGGQVRRDNLTAHLLPQRHLLQVRAAQLPAQQIPRCHNFSTAVHWEYVPLNPATGVKLPPRPLRGQLRFLTTDEVSRLLSALEEPGRTLVLMAVLTGMRIGELLALRWKNVDFEGKTIRVREAVYEGHNSTPKTQGGNRDIPFGPTLEQALRNDLGRRGTSDDSLVFPSRNGTYLRPGNLHKRWLLPACAKAELRRFSWHDFRRRMLRR
jgi:integrase